MSVFCDYDLVDPPFNITYGYSKDKRPDLKRFLVSMLCVECNIPILGTTTDGNASDKTLNNELLTNISKHMAQHGLQPGAYVYVADSAFVTEDNLTAAILEAPEKVNPLREEAGCFVLLTNLDQPTKWSAGELLCLYKNQIGIEKNFNFLKDPAIVNSIFLKKAERIEVLGLVLLISLLIWRLMERSM